MVSYKLRRLIPVGIKSLARSLTPIFLFSDVRSIARYWKVIHHESSDEYINLRVNQLGKNRITIRPNSRDPDVIFSTFYHKYHLPPPGVVNTDASIILDLGANIGCTMAHFASIYPNARIIGVELDSDNARLCRENIGRFGDRCLLIEGAVWPEDGEISYHYSKGNEDSFAVASNLSSSKSELKRAKAFSMSSLLSKFSLQQNIDYVKMDIEGAESSVLKFNTEWASMVKCIKVELHDDYDISQAISDLSKLGFEACADSRHHSCVLGIRRNLY